MDLLTFAAALSLEPIEIAETDTYYNVPVSMVLPLYIVGLGEEVEAETNLPDGCLDPLMGCPDNNHDTGQLGLGTVNLFDKQGLHIGKVFTTQPNANTPHWTERWVLFDNHHVTNAYMTELTVKYQDKAIVEWQQYVTQNVHGDPAVAQYTYARLEFNYFEIPAPGGAYPEMPVIGAQLYRVENMDVSKNPSGPKDSVEEGWLYREIIDDGSGTPMFFDHWTLKDDYFPPGFPAVFDLHVEEVTNVYTGLNDFLADQYTQEQAQITSRAAAGLPAVSRWKYAPIVYTFGGLPHVAN